MNQPMYKSLLKSRINPFIVAALVSLLVFPAFRADSRKAPKNYVVMVSLDAFRWDYPSMYKTPTLNDIARKGVSAEHMIASFPTNTFPNHYSIATGLYPDHHGLVNNSFAAPELGLFYRMGDRSAVENPAFYGGEPVWVTAQKQGILAASFYWVGSEAPVGGMHPHYWKKYDESAGYAARIDTVVKWLSYHPEKRPGLVTLYFDEPDATSHDAGPVSPATERVVEHLDSLMGVLREKLAALPIADRINLIILSDHGMAAVSPERYINLKKYVPDRMMASVTGGNPVYMINPAEGKTDSILLLFGNVRGLKAYRKGELPARWNYGTHPRIPEIIVVADSSWSIGTRPDGSNIRGGAHGYDNYNPDLWSIFYAEGPAFKKNYRTGELHNVDIYNLVCRILGLKPAPNDGDKARIRKLLR